MHDDVATALSRMTPAQARTILYETIALMVENEAWDAAASLMVDQLGHSDALHSALRYGGE